MARLWSCGFEMLTATDHLEWQSTNGLPTVSTTVKRSGAGALRCNPSAAVAGVTIQAYNGSDPAAHVFLREYIRVDSYPSATTSVMAWANNGTGVTGFYAVHLKTDGTLFMGSSGATSGGTPSGALTLGQWYRLEMEYDDSADTLTGYLDGVNFSGTLSSLDLGGGAFARFGIIQSCTADIYIDDVAVNDTSGSNQTGLPGEGYIVHMKPDSAGDNTGFTTTVGGTANWNRVSEAPPNDSSSYNATTASGTTTIDDFNMTSGGSLGIGSADTIKLVAVGARVGSDSATAANLIYRIKSQASGTVLEGASVSCALNGWTTHDNVSWQYQLTSYVDPQAGGAWTTALLDSAQIGYRTNVSQTTTRRVTTIWALVEFTKNYTQSNDESVGVTDSRVFVQGKSISESAGLTDSVEVGKVVVTSDSEGLTDSAELSQGHARDVSDSAGVTDAATVHLALPTEELTEDFTSTTVDAVKWPDSYGTYSQVAGRGRVACDTDFSAFSSESVYFLKDSEIFVRAYPVALAGATVECRMQLLIRSSTAGTQILMEYNAISNTINMENQVGEFDAGAVSIAYDSTNHAYWRVRESAGTLYWDTSADGLTWTNRRNTTSPGWVNDGDLNVQLLAHRSDGTNNFAEWDNVNVHPVDENVGVTDVAVLSRGLVVSESAGVTDVMSSVYNGIRTPDDLVGVTDTRVYSQGTVKADTVAVTDSVNIDHETVPVVAASTRPLIGLSIRLFDSSGAVTDVCPDLKALSWTEEVSQSGTVTMEYPTDGVNYSSLVVDRAEGAVFWGDYEIPGTRFLVAEQARDVLDEKGAVARINAPAFVGKRLTEAIVHPPRWPVTTPVQQEFNASTPGGIMQTLILQSQSRGVLTNLDYDFSSTSDSNGNAWTQNVTMTVEVGTTYRQVLQKLVEMAVCDWKADHRKLRMFNWDTMGTDRSVGSSPIVLYAGRDVIDAPVNRSVLDLVNTVFSLGEEGWSSYVQDAGSVATYGRIEGFISSQGVYNTGTLSVIGQALIDKMKHPQEEFTHNLTWADSTSPNPYIDYFVGDKVLRSVNGTTASYTVRQMTFSMDENGDVKTTVTLNDKFYTQDIILSRKIDALTGGSSSSTSGPADPSTDTVAPDAPTAVLVNSGAYVGNGGITYAAVTASWTAPATNTDGSTMTDLDYYEVQWKQTADTVWHAAGTSDDTTLQWSGVSPGVDIQVRVRAVDDNQNKSAWSATATHTTDDDTTPPDQPSTPTTTNYLGVIRVAWDGLTSSAAAQPGDYAGTNVYISGVNGFTPSDATKVDTMPGAAVSVISALHDGTALAYGTTYYVKLISFDVSGNMSTESVQTSATPAQVVQTDIGTGQVGLTNLSFSDVGNLIDDGSFELANWRASRASLIPAFASFATDEASNGLYSLKLVGTTSTGTWTIRQGITVRPSEVYVGAWDFRVTAGFTGTVILIGRFRDSTGAQVGSAFSLCRVPVGSAGSTWFLRQTDVELTAPANASTVDLELSVTSLVGTVWLDAVEVRQRVDSLLVANAAITNAKIANLAVNDAKISDLSVAKVTAGTISADWIVGARIKTADAGARVELNSTGIKAYDSGGTNTVSFSSADGSAFLMGQVTSGESGQRLILNPTATLLPEMRLYPNSGSNYAFVNGFSSGTNSYLGANSGTFTQTLNSVTSHNRLVLTGTDGPILEMVRTSDEVQNGPRLSMQQSLIHMSLKNTNDTEKKGYLELGRTHATWGVNGSTDTLDCVWFLNGADGVANFHGKWDNYATADNDEGLFTGSVVQGAATSMTLSYGVTMSSSMVPIVSCAAGNFGTGTPTVWGVQSQGTASFTVAWNNSQGMRVNFWCYRV